MCSTHYNMKWYTILYTNKYECGLDDPILCVTFHIYKPMTMVHNVFLHSATIMLVTALLECILKIKYRLSLSYKIVTFL